MSTSSTQPSSDRKRRRTDDVQQQHGTSSSSSSKAKAETSSSSKRRPQAQETADNDRREQLRLAPSLEAKLGQRYCATSDELVQLLFDQKLVSRVATFEVKATRLGDTGKWMAITLDEGHATTADVKAGIERVKGIKPRAQELYRFDEEWKGTEGSAGGGSGDYSKEQEERAFVDEGFVFEDP